MNLRLRSFTFIVCCVLHHCLSAQSLKWARSIGGTHSERGNSIATDDSGNVYITGYFNGTVDFDPGVGTSNLVSVGEEDIFIQKLDAAGNLVWVRKFGGANSNYGNAITVDASGNIYTTFFFKGNIDFDPGAGTSNLASSGYKDIFIHKMNASGNLIWAKRVGGTTIQEGNDITTDDSGNVYITGSFNGTVDFNPGAGVFNLITSGSAGTVDIFIEKLDAAGNFIWAKRIGGNADDLGSSICTDASGNVYTTGSFRESVDFDPGTGSNVLISAGEYDVFVEVLNSSGNFIWARSFGGTNFDRGNSIAVDASSNVYTSGYFSQAVDFDPGPGNSNYTSAGNEDLFVQKMNAAGNFLWAKIISGTLSESASSTALDAGGNVYTTGAFEGTTDFDPGPATLTHTSGGLGPNIFVHKLDSSGNFMWVKPVSGTWGGDVGTAITVHVSGAIYTTGFFSGTKNFNADTGVTNLTSVGAQDIFVQKISQAALPVKLVYFDARAIKNDGVKLDWQTATERNNHYFTIERSPNGSDWDALRSIKGAGNSSIPLKYSLMDEHPLQGTLYYRLKQTDLNGEIEYLGIQAVNIDLANISITALPNPTADAIQLHLGQKMTYVELLLLDVRGKEIWSKFYDEILATRVELPDEKGIYILMVKTEQGQNSLKVMKE